MGVCTAAINALEVVLTDGEAKAQARIRFDRTSIDVDFTAQGDEYHFQFEIVGGALRLIRRSADAAGRVKAEPVVIHVFSDEKDHV